jgi:integrase
MSLLNQKTTTTSMEWDQFKSLISKLERDGEYKFCLLISVGVFTGLRVSDLLQLKFNQFIGTEFLNIIEKKTKKDRRIKINSDLKDIVEMIKLKMNVIDDEPNTVRLPVIIEDPDTMAEPVATKLCINICYLFYFIKF